MFAQSTVFILERQNKSLKGFPHDKICMTLVHKEKKNFKFSVCPHRLIHIAFINVDENYMDAPMGQYNPGQVRSV